MLLPRILPHIPRTLGTRLLNEQSIRDVIGVHVFHFTKSHMLLLILHKGESISKDRRKWCTLKEFISDRIDLEQQHSLFDVMC